MTKQLIERIGADVENIQAQVGTINIALKKHDDELSKHRKLISEHSEGLKNLEQKLNAASITPTEQVNTISPRSVEATNPSTTAKSTIQQSTQKFDINRFSEQEKRILAVFFQNKTARLSYVDVAKMLNKSAHTIKNQMRQIRQKADLFDLTVGNQSRNLFKLKDDLRIEKYLNVGQPIERPISTTWTR